MRILIVNSDYPEFVSALYSHHPGLETEPYSIQLEARMATMFAEADFYSKNLQVLGHEAHDLLVNSSHLQAAWSSEHAGPRVPLHGHGSAIRDYLKRTPLRRAARAARSLWPRKTAYPTWVYRILEAQIAYYRPDVVLNQDMGSIEPAFWVRMKPLMRLLVGQHAATPLPPAKGFSVYDLVVSSFPPTVKYFSDAGIPSEFIPLGFEPEVLSKLGPQPPRDVDVSFVGGLNLVHRPRLSLIEDLCRAFPGNMKIWTPRVDSIPRDSPIHRCYQEPAWGADMLQVLRRSRITINHHGDILPFANNCRLYEATGTGALLVTDSKENLGDLFDVGREVVAYDSNAECVDLVRRFLDDEPTRSRIALAGQTRTLRDHTYRQCMELLSNHMSNYLARLDS